MILFATILDLVPSVVPSDFMSLVINWNNSSTYAENVVPGVLWHGEESVHFGDVRLSMDIIWDESRKILAVRHRKVTGEQDLSITWDTDFVANFLEHKVSIRLDRTYSEDALVFNGKFSTPHFITLLINSGFLEEDVDIPVSREPWMISDEQADQLAAVLQEDASNRLSVELKGRTPNRPASEVKGRGPYQLPIVYVAKNSLGEDPVPVGWLASRLKGAAHVLVETSTDECRKLREIAGESPEEFGAVRIYYPSDGVPRKRFHFRSNTGHMEERLEKVIRHVIQYRNAQRVDPLYTWAGVNGAVLQGRLSNQRIQLQEAENARADAQTEVQELYDTFNEDLSSLQQRVEQLMRENEALTYENQRLRARISEDEGKPIICQGDEEEFYPSEFREIVMDILADAMRDVEDGTRRQDLLQDILNSNAYEKICDEKKQKVKNIFRGYKNLTGTMRQDLAELGITIHEDGKHYKLMYRDDPRYMVTIPKTPSDNRSGNNTAAIVNKVML